MRRSQTLRHNSRPAVFIGSDELGLLGEGDESDTLRRQLLEKQRENDKLQDQILQLQAQLAQRPPLETIQELRKEYTNLEIILQGTQRENERCMAELERAKQREKSLEKELERLAGANWQENLDITPNAVLSARSAFASPGHARSPSTPIVPAKDANPTDPAANKAFIEQVRLLILGMEQRLQDRERRLAKDIEKAEAEVTKFEDIRKQIVA
ncbi:hypothetical protein NM688_g1341 [Phlebia brevispora]|uniref:Uncharacterized protein n=1 Tax=Phlebia brevispora TaxID=194682 RepID=A0ACC1TBS8_9APHY|nr:hypothetical protein NM688_g1341 [Phlebia brevispora]